MNNMTTGSIANHMLRFTLPLILGNIFHQLYNAVDAVIVGRLIGKPALAAVGSAGAIMNVLLFLIAGMSLGASILIAQFYGAQDYDNLKKEMGTAVKAGAVFTAFITVAALLLADTFLKLINTPAAIMPEAGCYLKIISAGLGFTFFYNIFSASLRALGNAKAPIVFLFICSVINAGLDIVFIKYCHLGVAGAAWATVVAQALAALMCFIYIAKKSPLIYLRKKDVRIEYSLLKKTMQYSGIYAFQQSFLYIGVLLVQGAVNTQGINYMAAYNAVTKVDGFALMPGDSLADSLSTFVAQNRGANQRKRILSGLKHAIFIGLLYCSFLALLLPQISGHLMGMFLDPSEQEAIAIGVSYLRIMSILYIITAVCNTFQGFYRGLGLMRITLNATVIQIPIRVILSYSLINSFQLNAVPLATGIGWSLMIIYELFEFTRYLKTSKSK
ncbi:MATE family efflux transporter [Deltaproteobacteria bacterium Smac51]|nr:MATE family efflux transporter [Deltaproteobacteria bacterium Smac51]